MTSGDGLSAGTAADIVWEAVVRNGDVELKSYLDDFHAVVVGEMGRDGTFANHLSYLQVARAL